MGRTLVTGLLQEMFCVSCTLLQVKGCVTFGGSYACHSGEPGRDRLSSVKPAEDVCLNIDGLRNVFTGNVDGKPLAAQAYLTCNEVHDR